MPEYVADGKLELDEFNFEEGAIEEIAHNYFVQQSWPLVYFIDHEERKIAYVGESTNALMRMRNHLANKERKKLKRLTLIASNQFNKSAALEFESRLIQYLKADKTYNLQNRNGGLKGHNFYQKSLYADLFNELWEDFRRRGLVRKSIAQLENTNLFKYSPYKSLTQDQRDAVFRVIDALANRKAETFFIEGSAGTGKTIVASYIMMLLQSDFPTPEENLETETYTPEEYAILKRFHERWPKPKMALVIPMTSLRDTLKKVFSEIKPLSSKMVIGPAQLQKEVYDIVLVDESHRLSRRKGITNYRAYDAVNEKLGLPEEATQLDWVLKQSKSRVLFYDSKQSIKPADVPEEVFQQLKEESMVVKLRSQMRVTAGIDYINFIDDVMHCRASDAPEIPKDYDLRLFESFQDLHDALDEKEREMGLCRKVAGYGWKWVSKGKDSDLNDIEIEGLSFKWNSETSDFINSPNAPKEVGCIHTTQGYDLNYVGVIVGNEVTYNPELNRIEVIKENYFDSKGKGGIKNPEELREYILNIYKTILYRGIKGCYIYVCDPRLRAYFVKRFKELGDQYIVRKGAHIKGVPEEPFRKVPVEQLNREPDAIPLFPHYAAAGDFVEQDMKDEAEWVVLNGSRAVDERYFVLKVVGESMNKRIPNGAYCLFKKYEGGTRENLIVLAQHSEGAYEDEPVGLTVKRYSAEKKQQAGRLVNVQVKLSPESEDASFEPITIDPESDEVQILAEFVEVL